MCDCSSLNTHVLLRELSGGKLRTGGPSRCCTKARRPQDLRRGSGPVVLLSKSSGWRARIPREVPWVARRIITTFSDSPDSLRLGCFGVEHGGRISVRVSRNSGDYEPERYESLKEVVFPGVSDGGLESAHPGPLKNPEEEGKRSTRDSSVPSSFDILELKRELEKEEREAGIKDRSKGKGDLIPAEDFERALSDSEENTLDRVSGSRVGRQMVRRSGLIAKQVISMQSARSLGFVSELWVDTTLWIVVVVEVKPNLLSGEIEKLLLEDVHQVGDVVLVEDESVMENEVKMIGLDTLVGYDVVTSGRRNIGKVRGYNFDINSGAVESLELDSFGMSIIPAGLVSTYCLMVEDVIEVLSDTIVVHEVAASRLQRLTKGFWDAPKSEASLDDIVDFADFRRRTNRSVRRRRRAQDFSRRKFQDDWDLPLDF